MEDKYYKDISDEYKCTSLESHLPSWFKAISEAYLMKSKKREKYKYKQHNNYYHTTDS